MNCTAETRLRVMRAACASVNRRCRLMDASSSPPSSTSVTMYVWACQGRGRVSYSRKYLQSIHNNLTLRKRLLLFFSLPIYRDKHRIAPPAHLVIEDIVECDDIGVALARSQQLDLLRCVQPAEITYVSD